MTTEDSIVLVDMDGTAWDFEGNFLETWRRLYPNAPYVRRTARSHFYIREDYPSGCREAIRAITTAPGFLLASRPFPGAMAALREMEEAGYTVFLCSSPVSRCPHNLVEKQQLIERDCPGFSGRLIVTKDKTLVRGRWLFDDRPSVTGLVNPTWEHVLVDAPYNCRVTGKRRVRSLADWREVIAP